MSNSNMDRKPDGTYSGGFESLRKKVDHVTGINDVNSLAAGNCDIATTDSEDEKVVDEIESLCMNCHENVSLW
jgi:hypothetical protein